jgi:glutathione S-transferase
METYWLKDTPYLTGQEPTIADLSAACELAQTNAITKLASFKPEFAKVYAWLDRMLQIPVMKEIHAKTLPQLGKFFNQIDEQNSDDAKL